jgi:hypothetical protein
MSAFKYENLSACAHWQADGLNSGRFLDPPEFVVFHDKGNEENFFDCVDYIFTKPTRLKSTLSTARRGSITVEFSRYRAVETEVEVNNSFAYWANKPPTAPGFRARGMRSREK